MRCIVDEMWMLPQMGDAGSFNTVVAVDAKGMQRRYNKITKDAGDAKWMQEACRHFDNGCKACIVDAPQTASFSFHPAVSVDDFRYWMPEGKGCQKDASLHPQL